jgi:hypothetical protein
MILLGCSGFKLDSLENIKDVKMVVTPKRNLVHYLIQILDKEDPTV